MQKLNEKPDLRSSRKTRKSYEAKFLGLKRLSLSEILDSNTSPAEKLRTLFREQWNHNYRFSDTHCNL